MVPLATTAASPVLRAPPMHVIVADDVEEIRSLIGNWLEHDGHYVMQAGTGEEVIRLLRHEPCDLVIADILMPDGDGLDVITTTRRMQPSPRVLAISGGGRYMAANDCLRIARGIGADGVLLKPFKPEELRAAVERVMRGA